ncbi:uncharacterized protein OCT59_027360 [Rhizophagus irregularis]|uniref:uncharacterized protein n=1 Tax=Rhizophagus irregularis TaxID=588596 RepID=UPI003329C4E2|nr:hypothetical protein OCT59_027360 [Rhizophagus irregularis]
MRALLAEENIILNQEIKNYIIDDCFWEEHKNLRDFLELFINFIRKLEGNEPYLSSAFVTLRDIEIIYIYYNPFIIAKYRWDNFLYNPAVIIAYRLDPRFNGELVNSGNWHDIIEEEIIRIAGKENEVGILRELEVPLTVKELIKSGVKMSDLESDDEKLGEESDKELEGDIDSNFETLTEYEENEFDLDLDD